MIYSILERNEAMEIFQKSGLDATLLPGIYAMADADQDGKLTSKEFSVAFHLILCLT